MDFRINSWYRISSAASLESQLSLSGSFPFIDGENGIVTYGVSNNEAPAQQWQIYPVGSSLFMLRTKASGPNGFLVTEKTNASDSDFAPSITSTRHASMLWRIDPWGDGTFHFSNIANGRSSHLDFSGLAKARMSTNITQPQPGQSFSFLRVGEINDPSFSTVLASPDRVATLAIPSPTSSSSSSIVTASSTLSTSTRASSTTHTSSIPSSTAGSPAPSSTASQEASSNALSPSAAMGIGVAVGVLGLISITALGLFIFQRWKGRKTPENLHYRRAKLWKGFTPQQNPSRRSDGLVLSEATKCNERIWIAELPIVTPTTAHSTPNMLRSPPPSAGVGRNASWGSYYGFTPTTPDYPFVPQTPTSPPVELPG